MLLIFDCDGVLRPFSHQGVYEAYLEIAKYLGKDPQELWKNADEFRKWVNYIEWEHNLERLGMPLGSDYTQIRKIFHDVGDPHTPIFDWLEEVLEDLSTRHELAVLTASISSSINKSLAPVSKYFSHIITSDHVANVKPDPEGIHLIMEKVGAKPDETLMIGDAWVDIAAGQNAGVLTGGVHWGMSKPEELLIYNPDCMFRSYHELRLL